jgi:uncharacterized cysteine cluster protein YcgN (CxxCxxCC family)
MVKPFWKDRKLTDFSASEWESLCDGCGKCCVIRYQDEDTEEILNTDVVCRFLDLETVRCTCYQERQTFMPECMIVTPQNAHESWLPPTCAYHLLSKGEPLPEWHHLVSGDRNTIHEIGESVFGSVISEEYIHPDEIEDRIRFEDEN